MLLGEALALGPAPLPPDVILKVMGASLRGPLAELLLCGVRLYIEHLEEVQCADVLCSQRKKCAEQVCPCLCVLM